MKQELSVWGRSCAALRASLVGVRVKPFCFKHTHPGEEIIYVLEGSLEYQVEGKPPTTLSRRARSFSSRQKRSTR